MEPISSQFRLGILGGGQLGKMLCLAAHNWDLQTWVLDPNPNCSCASLASHFETGHFDDYETVLQFGRQVQVLTIEIEHVNVAALQQLAAEGVKVHPSPDALSCIKDKGLQKQFYAEKGLPTSAFRLFEDAEALKSQVLAGKVSFPFVQKTRTGGYDGRGVQVIQTAADLAHVLDGPCLIEDLVPIQKELAVIAARNERGEVCTFPPVEMAFHATANLVEFLCCPADIPPNVAAEAEALAQASIEAFGVCGLLAVEMFWTTDGMLLINEVAPRPHNSGHHTIDSAFTSQFEQHLRGVLNLPLGDTTQKIPAVMVNLLGETGYKGEAKYEGLADVLAVSGVKLHLYGKRQTSPFRKMGHVTILASELTTAIKNARFVQKTLRIISDSKA